jgi:FAD-dependent urate hydroxylase
MTEPKSLAELEAEYARQRLLLNLPPKSWMPATTGPEGEPVLDVAIVGAGLCGLVANAALQMEGITNVRLLDRAPAGQEGPWITFARMRTLRTIKEAAGPALGIPALTFRAWFEAQWGRDAWDDMTLAPRTMWMDYLNWYRKMTRPDVLNDCDVAEILPEGALFRLRTSAGDIRARRVILAMGLDALGAPKLPPVTQGLPKGTVYHSADVFDVDSLKGKRVIVVGAGASAMDNAAAALEVGCARLDLLVRRPALPAIDKFTGTGSRGMTAGFVALHDAQKWALMDLGGRFPVPPPAHSVARVARHDNARLHLGAPIKAISHAPEGLTVETPQGRLHADVAIFATGFGISLQDRPELAELAPHWRTWGDVVGAEKAAQNPELAAHPHLNPDFTFAERAPDSCPALARLCCFAYAAVPSHGKVTSGIPSATEGARRLAGGLVRSFFAEDAAYHLARFETYDTPDFSPDIWPATQLSLSA